MTKPLFDEPLEFDSLTFKEAPEPEGGFDSLKMAGSDETFGEYRRVKPTILGVFYGGPPGGSMKD